MSSQPPQPMWYLQSRQWFGLAMAAVLLILVVSVLVLQRQSASLHGSLVRAVNRQDHQEHRRTELEDKRTEFGARWQMFHEQKEDIARQIADFRNQLDLLKVKVAGQEHVVVELRNLEVAYDKFKDSEQKFLERLRAAQEHTGRGGAP